MMELGAYIEYEGKPAIRFERTYPYPVGDVWAAITEPEKLARWFPSGVTHESRAGGRIEFSGDPYSDPSVGTILAFEPPTIFACIWGSDELHFTLEDLDDGCRFVLINVLEAADTAARNASGWTVCLAELDKDLAGRSGGGPHSRSAEAGFEAIMRRYIDAGMPSGAQIPGKRD